MPLPGQMTQLIGPAGLNVTPNEPSQSPWLENVVMDSDGTWRPRYGLRLVHKFVNEQITMLAPWFRITDGMCLSIGVMGNVPDGFGGYTHRLHTATASNIINNTAGGTSGTSYAFSSNLALVVVGSAAMSRYPTSRSVGVVSDITKECKVLFSYLADVTNDYIIEGYTTDSAGLSDPSTILITGSTYARGFNWSHSYHTMSLGDRETRWSAYSNVNSWPTANFKIMPGEMGKPLVGLPLGVNTSYIFCENGVMQLYGEIDTRFRWAKLDIPTCISPHGCAVSTGEKIFYLSPGPKIGVIGSDLSTRADIPIAKDLRGIAQGNDVRAYYDPLHDAYCLTGTFDSAKRTYLLSNATEQWQGIFTFADSNFVMQHCASVGPKKDSATTHLNSKPPFSLTCIALNSANDGLLCYWDPTLFTDQTAVGTSTAFTCAIESAPTSGDDIYVDKMLSDVYVECYGTWTVKLLYRDDPQSTWTSATIGTVSQTSPWLHPSAASMPVYKERKLRLEATSSETLRVRRVSINERTLGASR